MSISGTVSDPVAVAALAGVTMTLEPGAITATTDGAGVFIFFPDPPAAVNYTLTPSKSGWTFTPASESFFYDGGAFGFSFDATAAAAPAAPAPTRRTPLPVQLVHVRIASGTTYYFSTSAYSDAGRRYYLARLLDWVSYERSVGCVLWDRQSRSAVGAIELANADGGLSALLSEDAEGATVRVYECTDEDAIEAATLVATGRVVSIDAEDRRVVRIVLQDPLGALDVPLQTALYVSSDGVQEDLVGTPVPVSIGAPLSVPLTLRDFGDQIYDVHDNPDDLVSGGMLVRDGGASVTFALATGAPMGARPYAGPELAARAVGQLVADVATGAGSVTTVIGSPLGDFVTDLTGWTVDADGGSVTWESPGRARIIGTATQQPSLSAGSVTAGNSYSWSLTVADLTEGALEVLAGGERIAFLDTAGPASGDFVCGADGVLTIRSATGSGAIGDTVRPSAINTAVDTVRLTRQVFGGTASEAIQRVVSRAGLEPDLISTGSLVAFGSARPWLVAYHTSQPVQAIEVVREILESVIGWAYSRPDGRIALGVLQPPDTGTIRGTILRTQWLSGPTTPRDTAPGLAAAVAGLRNWRPYSASELVDDPAIDSFRAALTADYRTRITVGPVSTELGPRRGELRTLLSDFDSLDALADLLPDLYPPTAKPRFITGELPRELVAGWLPGDRITVEIPGGPSIDCRLVGTVVQRQRCRITLWGWL